MREKLEKLYTLLKTTPLKKTVTLGGLLLVLLALPLTVLVAQQQQNLTQHAASNTCVTGQETIKDGKIVGCHNGVFDTPSATVGVKCPPGFSAQPTVGKPGDYSCYKTAVATTTPVASNPPADATKQTVNPAGTQTAVQTGTTAQTTAPTPKPGAKDGDSCTPGSSPAISAVANGDFTYCDPSKKLHVGKCKDGNIPQLGGTASGVVCKTPDFVAAQKPLVKTSDIVTDKAKADSAANSTKSCYDTPGQTCIIAGTCGSSSVGAGSCDGVFGANQKGGQCCNVGNSCGTIVPPDFWAKVGAQAQKENPTKNISGASDPWDALTPDQYTTAAKNAGFSQAVIDQSGSIGNPYTPIVCQNHPEQCSNIKSGSSVQYTGCLGVSDDFGTASNMKAFCYKNGELVGTPTDITGNTDMVGLAASVFGSQCVPGGWSPQAVATGTGGSGGTSKDKETTNNGQADLGLSVGLNGFTSTDTSVIKDIVRNFMVQITNQQGQVVDTKNANLNFDKATKKFKGTVKVNNVSQSSGYKVAVESPGYLQETLQQTIPLTPGKGAGVNLPDLKAGNITGDSVAAPTLLDYNVFISCSIFSTDNGAACKDKNGQSLKQAADLNGDGVVDQDDYNILLRSWKLLQR